MSMCSYVVYVIRMNGSTYEQLVIYHNKQRKTARNVVVFECPLPYKYKIRYVFSFLW